MDLSLITLRWQRWTVYAAAAATALVFWRGAPDAFGLPKATILWVAAVVALALAVARVVWQRVARLPRSPWAIAVAVFAAAVAVATLASPSVALSVVGEYTRYTGLLSYAAFAVLGLVTLRAFDVDEGATLLRVLCVGGGLVVLYGTMQTVGIEPLDWANDVADKGAFATLGNANLLSGFSAILVPAALWCVLTETNDAWLRIVGAVAAGLGVVAAVGSLSSQGPAAMAVGVIFLVVVWQTTTTGRALRERAGISPQVFRGVAIGAGVLAVLAAVPLLARALRSGLVERGDFWRAALRMAEGDPLLGVGFDTYGQHFSSERSLGHALSFGSHHAESAHSVPLNLLAGGGLLVALAWLAVVALTGLSLWRGLRRLDGEERLLLGALGASWLAYLVQAAVSFDVPPLGVLHFVLAGTIVAVGTPPRWAEITVPGPGPARRRGSRQAATYSMPTSTAVLLVVIAGAALLLAWHATRPLRADLAAGRVEEAISDGDAESAIADVDSAIGLASWQGRYWLLRAQLNEVRSEVLAAAADAEEAARREPGSAQYALTAAQLNAQYKDDAAARPWFEEALRRDPHNPVIRRDVARWAVGADPAWALELASALFEDQPTTEHEIVLSVAQVATGDADGEATLRRVVDADPFGADAYSIYEALGRHDPALANELAGAMVEARPDDADVLAQLGELQLRIGLDAEAQASFEAALELVPDHHLSVTRLREMGVISSE